MQHGTTHINEWLQDWVQMSHDKRIQPRANSRQQGGRSPFEALLGQQQALEESQAGCHDADDWGHQAIEQAPVWPLRLLFLPRGG